MVDNESSDHDACEGVSPVSDVRFNVPLYTVGEAARILDVPTSTFRGWARGYVRRWPTRPDVTGEAIVTALPQHDAIRQFRSSV